MFHVLRHTYASVQLEAGESIVSPSKWLGHSTPKVALAHYAHFMPGAGQRGLVAMNAWLEDRHRPKVPEKSLLAEWITTIPSNPHCMALSSRGIGPSGHAVGRREQVGAVTSPWTPAGGDHHRVPRKS
jgi:hypothetical protein